jgi:hypothetical protein
MDNSMAIWSFHHILCEWCVYVHTVTSNTNIVVVHVDNMVFTVPTHTANEAFKVQL